MNKLILLALGLNIFSSHGEAKTKAKIKIGRMSHVMCHSPALLLDRKNLLKDAGVKDFELKYFSKGSKSALALGAKETNMAFFGAIIPAIANGLEAKIVAVNSMGGTQLVCRGDSKVSKLEDLKGQTVGSIGPTSAPTSIFKVALNSKKVLDKVEFRHINRRNIVMAMTEKKVVECAVLIEPLTTEAVKRGAKVVINETELYNKGDYPFTFVVAHQDFIKSDRSTVAKVIKAHKKAQKILTSEKDTAYPLIQKYFKENNINIPLDVFSKAMDTNTFKSEVSKKVMQELIDVMIASKTVRAELKFEEVVDCSFGTCVD